MALLTCGAIPPVGPAYTGEEMSAAKNAMDAVGQFYTDVLNANQPGPEIVTPDGTMLLVSDSNPVWETRFQQLLTTHRQSQRHAIWKQLTEVHACADQVHNAAEKAGYLTSGNEAAEKMKSWAQEGWNMLYPSSADICKVVNKQTLDAWNRKMDGIYEVLRRLDAALKELPDTILLHCKAYHRLRPKPQGTIGRQMQDIHGALPQTMDAMLGRPGALSRCLRALIEDCAALGIDSTPLARAAGDMEGKKQKIWDAADVTVTAIESAIKAPVAIPHKENPDTSPWQTVSEIATSLDIPKPTISKACDRGEIKSVGSGRRRRVDPVSAMQFKNKLMRRFD